MNQKVLHISVRADMGGGPKHIQHLVNNIREGTQCYIACPDDKPFFDIYSELVGKSNITVIPHRKFSLPALFTLLNFTKVNNINLIHCHGRGASAYGKLIKVYSNRINIVYTPHGIYAKSYSKISKYSYILFEKLTSFLFSHLIHVSESEKTTATDLGIFKRSKYSIIPNGVPEFNKSSVSSGLDLKKKLFTDPGKKVVLTFSRFDFMKNMNEAMEIAALSKEYNFLWLGIGDEFNAIQAKIKENKIENIILAGQQNNINDYLSISNAYLTTSRGEGMPLALLEAMSAGIPVLASNVIGHTDIINEKTGVLYTLGNISEAAEKLRNILNDNVLDKRTIQEHFSANYSSTKMAISVLEVYNSKL